MCQNQNQILLLFYNHMDLECKGQMCWREPLQIGQKKWCSVRWPRGNLVHLEQLSICLWQLGCIGLFQYICVIHFLFQATGVRESKLAAKGFSHLVEAHFKKILTNCEPHDATDRDKDAVRCLNSWFFVRYKITTSVIIIAAIALNSMQLEDGTWELLTPAASYCTVSNELKKINHYFSFKAMTVHLGVPPIIPRLIHESIHQQAEVNKTNSRGLYSHKQDSVYICLFTFQEIM